MILVNTDCIITTTGNMRFHSVRLRRGDDLLKSIKAVTVEKEIKAGVVLSAVGCVTRARLRDASGVTVQEINEDCEIVSLNGTVSHARCHLHLALSKEDLSTVGGHMKEGCIVNTTCELIIGELPGQEIDVEFDEETGYDELIFREV